MANSNVVNQLSTSGFLSGVGVDTHVAYTDGGYANVPNIISYLKYLGIDQIRDGVSNGLNGSASLQAYFSIAQAGNHFTFIAPASTSAELSATLGLIDRVQQAAPGSVIAIEGPNEINNAPLTYNGVGGLQGALNLQAAIYTAVHADPVLAGAKVDYFTGYAAGGIPVGPDPVATGLADYNNQHPYPNFGQAPAPWVSRSMALPNATSPTEPAVYTETGYSSFGVSPAVQAKYTLDLLFDTATQGISKTYLYQLMDPYAPGSPQGDDGLGLFDYTGAPKPVATAIHNLTTILGGGSGGAALTPLNYTLSGLPSTGNSLLLQKPDGSYVVAVWAEPQIWNSSTHTEVAAPTQAVTLSLPTSYGAVQVFDPLTGSTPVASYSNAGSVQFSLSDHPILISLAGPAAPGGGGGGGGGGTTGSDTLVLNVSEVPYAGQDAMFTVSVDGHQVGGVQTATALRSAGQGQDISLSGSFGAGPHTVSVAFVNGFAGAPADAGRVLYVNAVSFDRQASFTNTVLHSRGPQTYTVQAPATPLADNSGTHDTLTLNVGEKNPNGGDVQFMVAVDGQRVGGVNVVTAQAGSGQSQDVVLSGAFGSGAHTVTIDYLNGFNGDPANVNRVLNVNSITLDGAVTPEHAALSSAGAQSFSVLAGSATSAPATGPAVAISAQVLAQDTGASTTDNITRNGQITLTGTVSGASGTKVQVADGATKLGDATLDGAGHWTFATTLAAGSHSLHAVATDPANLTAATPVAPTVTVATAAPALTINAPVQAQGSTQVTLTGAVSDPVTTAVEIHNGAATLGAASVSNGAWSYSASLPAGAYTFQAIATDLAGNTASAADPPFTVTTPGSSGGGGGGGGGTTGADTLVLNVSEVPYGGQDAMFTVSVDGHQVGGVQTATALRSAGQGQDISLSGSFGAGAHTVSVAFVNGFAGAPADAGRVLYVNAVSFDHQASFPNTVLHSRGPQTYTVQAPATPLADNSGTHDTLAINVGEKNPNGGDVQFMVAVDGQRVGGVNVVTAQSGSGQSQDIVLSGSFGSGAHTVTIDYLNGFNGDQANVNRVLNVNSITLDGVVTPEHIAMTSAGAQTFSGWIT